jgi:hypothetical protein
MQQIIHNPVDGIYAATPDYVHALEVRRPERFLYVAGTMGLREDGSAPKTLDEQLEPVSARSASGASRRRRSSCGPWIRRGSWRSRQSPWRDRLRSPYSTVTDFARLRGLSMSHPRCRAT